METKKQIWKFELPSFFDVINVLMPSGAEILTVQSQGNDPKIWALVDPLRENEIRQFEVFSTGEIIYCPEDLKRKYISTFQLDNGALVFHVFEIIN